ILISSRTPRGGDAIMLHQATMLRIGDRIAITYHRRSVLIWCAVTVLLLSLSMATLMFGKLGISPAELVDVVRGQASATTEFALPRVRGPRMSIAILAAAAFGGPGVLCQDVAPSPLASPDALGLSAGAGAGVAAAALRPFNMPTPLGALAGAGIAIGLVT